MAKEEKTDKKEKAFEAVMKNRMGKGKSEEKEEDEKEEDEKEEDEKEEDEKEDSEDEYTPAKKKLMKSLSKKVGDFKK